MKDDMIAVFDHFKIRRDGDRFDPEQWILNKKGGLNLALRPPIVIEE